MVAFNERNTQLVKTTSVCRNNWKLVNRDRKFHTVVDFFSDDCNNKSVNGCSEFRFEVPLSEKFNSTAFDNYCG